ncbi:hypothetical protein CC80DRAFT_509791 [Byssothecium circinans]|uniref:Rhodopsin domain-containing protein n=1 Tax=Byssothecium circinans TaxID=147558 RepID=A0A6A5TMR0_9PLEO|nr:hypothetical protein CC80DRAFT_509791 [Byssothecium circinans]
MAGTGLQPLNIFLIVFPFVLSLIVVSVRVWRRVLSRQFAIEDWLIVIAEALVAALTGCVWKIVLVSYSGYHAKDIPKGAINVPEMLKWRFINNVMYNPILGLAKISFCITLLKLQSPKLWARIALWFLIGVNTAFIIAATLAHIFSCNPIDKAWLKSKPGKCVPDRRPYIYGVIGTTIITDVLVTLIPVAILHDLHMSRRSKISIIAFLSLPIAVTAIGIYRLQNFVVVLNLPSNVIENPYNVRNSLSNIESNLGIIAACGPTIKWILSCLFPYFAGDTTRPTDPSSPYTPSKPSRNYPSSRGYQKSQDIEMTVTDHEEFDRDSTSRIRKDDASDERCITDGITKTVVVDWHESAGTATPTSKTAERPRDML